MTATRGLEHQKTHDVDDADGGKTHLGPNNVHAMAACIEELLQLDKGLHLLSSSPTDDGGREQSSNSLNS